VSVPLDELSDLEEELIRKSAFFRFANRFAAERESIPEDFVVDDQTYEVFQTWLEDDGFRFESRTEWLFDELTDEAQSAGYSITSELDHLEDALASQKALEFNRYEDRLKEGLREEILARYFGETALIRASLTHDAQVQRAIETLTDPDAFRNALEGR
jgi:carboxyl-terminal processing protease